MTRVVGVFPVMCPSRGKCASLPRRRSSCFDESGQMIRTLPDAQSSGSVVAALLPAGAHYVKAFGTLAADALASAANREPQRAVLLYATDDDTAATTIERLIRVAGFEPLKAGGVADAGRIEMPGGDLHQYGLNGALLDLDQARAAVAAELSASPGRIAAS